MTMQRETHSKPIETTHLRFNDGEKWNLVRLCSAHAKSVKEKYPNAQDLGHLGSPRPCHLCEAIDPLWLP